MDWLSTFLGGLSTAASPRAMERAMGQPNMPPAWLATAGAVPPMLPEGGPPPQFSAPDATTTYTPTPDPTVQSIPAGPPPGGPSFFSPGGGLEQGINKLPGTLKGVQAPPARDVVKPTTPSAPQADPRGLGGGNDLLKMLLALGGAPQRPTTLGGAIGTGRY